jgi:hypothetical protein
MPGHDRQGQDRQENDTLNRKGRTGWTDRIGQAKQTGKIGQTNQAGETGQAE